MNKLQHFGGNTNLAQRVDVDKPYLDIRNRLGILQKLWPDRSIQLFWCRNLSGFHHCFNALFVSAYRLIVGEKLFEVAISKTAVPERKCIRLCIEVDGQATTFQVVTWIDNRAAAKQQHIKPAVAQKLPGNFQVDRIGKFGKRHSWFNLPMKLMKQVFVERNVEMNAGECLFFAPVFQSEVLAVLLFFFAQV